MQQHTYNFIPLEAVKMIVVFVQVYWSGDVDLVFLGRPHPTFSDKLESEQI